MITASAAVLTLAGCSAFSPQDEESHPDERGAYDAPRIPDLISPSRARTELEVLRRIPRQPAIIPYLREAFGPAWADVDGNRCNQRDDVLLRDATPDTTRTERQGACDHDVLAGTWLDPYNGKTLVFDDLKDLRQAQAIQIDHLVALAEAWGSGASTWTDERRLLFANDLDNLLAVDGPTNAGKGADDPAAWRPKRDYQCTYAARWIAVKDRWDLGADTSEVAALNDLLSTCPAGR